MKNRVLMLSVLLLTSLSCKTKIDQKMTKNLDDYKYRIHGDVYTKGGFRDAVFYTDTFSFVDGGRRLEYENSDGSVQIIYSPYRIEHIK